MFRRIKCVYIIPCVAECQQIASRNVMKSHSYTQLDLRILIIIQKLITVFDSLQALLQIDQSNPEITCVFWKFDD